MVDADMRELVADLLEAIHNEMTLAMKELWASWQIGLEEVRTPQLVRLCHAKAATTPFFGQLPRADLNSFCCPAGGSVPSCNVKERQSGRLCVQPVLTPYSEL